MADDYERWDVLTSVSNGDRVTITMRNQRTGVVKTEDYPSGTVLRVIKGETGD